MFNDRTVEFSDDFLIIKGSSSVHQYRWSCLHLDLVTGSSLLIYCGDKVVHSEPASFDNAVYLELCKN